MTTTRDKLTDSIAERPAAETLAIESRPAFFESHQGVRTAGTASVIVTRASIAIRFNAPEGLTVPKAGYGESNGRIGAQDGSWFAANVNDAGKTGAGEFLFGTMKLVVGQSDVKTSAATRMIVAGGAWNGEGELDGRRVLARRLSRETVSHHDVRMAITFDGSVEPSALEGLGRVTSFISGIDTETLAVERYDADGALIDTTHQRGFRRVGRATHSPFANMGDEYRMAGWTALASAYPRLIKDGVPIDHVLDQISAHNHVAQIHLSALMMLIAPMTVAYHRMHGDKLRPGVASRQPELALLNNEMKLGLSDEDMERFEKLRVELLDAGFFHHPGYETGRPQKDIKFIRDIAHMVVFRLAGYTGPFYGAERFAVRELA